MTCYKVTDGYGRTYPNTQWGPGIEHTASGEGSVFESGWICAYEHPLMAVFFNPLDVYLDEVVDKKILWEADGDIGIRHGHMLCGCTRLKTLRQIDYPVITLAQRVRLCILCAKLVYSDSTWNRWADNWLSGSDRSRETAGAVASASWETHKEMVYKTAWVAFSAAMSSEAAEALAMHWAARVVHCVEEALSTKWHTIDLIGMTERAIREEPA